MLHKPEAARPAAVRRDRRGAKRPERGPLRWWQRAVIYQIAPISFQDSDGDGRGDLPGLISRLDYLEWLGVGAVWLCPIYPSPMLDFGYDISDFCAIDDRYGTFADFDRLIEELHARDIRLLLDFVPNHTSDRHPWFIESRSSRKCGKRDWYVWADAAENGGPPNNWLSRFGGSAWEWDQHTEQYYYHAFLREQPDLNWRNPAVRTAMGNVLRFWLGRGVDGFRVDAAAVLAEDDLLRDEPPDPEFDGKTMPPPQRLKRIFTDDRPESMTYIEEIRAVIDEFPDRVLAGEVQGKTDRIGHFYDNNKPRLQLPLNFALLDCDWTALALQGAIDLYLKSIPDGAWPDWVIGGHDKRRIAGKIGQDQARVLAMLIMTLPGTPFLFAGDELAMPPVPIPPDRVSDIFEKLVPGFGLNRDPERAPMPWDDTQNAGFSRGEPWLPVAGVGRNVQALQNNPRSILHLYRRLIRLRREHEVLASGRYQPMRSRHDVLLFRREHGNEKIAIALNTVHEPRRIGPECDGRILLSTRLDRESETITGSTMLRPDEGLIIRLS